MRQPLRARTARVLAVVAIVGAVLAPATAVRAADPLILRTGTTQTVAGLNPWGVIDVVDFEIMTLNYDTLVGFGQDVEPVPGFAESWTRSADGLTWTFKIRPGMKWSDGQPATSEDARWTMQYVLDATKAERVLGAGYLEPYQTAAGVTAVTAPDPETLVVTSNLNNPLLLQSYIPILPKHVWSKLDPKAASSSFQNPAPIVGTGPYQVVEYKPGQFVRLQRNANYWGQQGAADQVVITTFKSDDTMIQALKKGELDYARDVPAAQWDALKANPGGPIVTTEGVSNTFYELAFNCYTKPIKGGGASTTAVQDPAFRDALGYAIDKQAIITKAFNGHATLGSTQITPFQAGWHAEPNDIRAFSIDTAKAKLDAAGYPLDASGKRLDKDQKPITLRLAWPGAPEEATAASLIVDWFAQLGIKVNAAPQDEAKLGAELLPPEADPPGKANFDMFIWDWVGDPDPTSLLKVLTTKEIGASSDSLWSNPQYDALVRQAAGRDRQRCSTSGSRPDAADHVRRGAVPRPVLPEPARRQPDRSVRRVEEPAVAERESAVRLRSARLHVPDRRQRPGAQPERVGDGVIVTGRIRGGGRIGPGRDRVRGTGTGADRHEQHQFAGPADRRDRGARGGAGRRVRHASTWQGGRRGGVTDSPRVPH